MSSSNTNQPILCIPGVFANIKEERIRRVFGDLDLGEVIKVDIIVPKKPIDTDAKENKFNRVFVHINWNDSQQSISCRERLSQGKDVKVIYDEPWFWRVSAYRPPAAKPKFGPNPKKVLQPKKAILQIDYEPEIKYSGVIAPALTELIAPGLSIQIQDEKEKEKEIIIKVEQENYKNVLPAPVRRKRIIIEDQPKK
jgi:hypothetical protein